METHKASGFVKYFWKFYPGPLQRIATLLLSGPIFLAIWTRVLLMDIRNKLGAVFGKAEKPADDERPNQAAE